MGGILEETTQSLRATLSGDGSPGPIEVRIGRRLIRLVEPDTDEARALLRSGAVELVGPGGESFGRVDVGVAWRALEARLASRLAAPAGLAAPEAEGVRSTLERLRARESAGIDS
jgi:hypothetical protein